MGCALREGNDLRLLPKEFPMGLILLVILLVLVLGSVPAYPYSRGWGYAPSGVLGLLVVVLLILLLLGTIPWGWSPGPVVP
jgi:hypothetical protein